MSCAWSSKQLCRFYLPFSDRFLQGNHPGCRPISYTGPYEPSAGELVANLRDLLGLALKPGSHKLYQQAWAVFQDFTHRFYQSSSPQFPLNPNRLAIFISYLSARQLVPSTIILYISTISYVHKLKGFSDPTSSFLIRKLLTVVSHRRQSDIRLLPSPARTCQISSIHQLFSSSPNSIQSHVPLSLLWVLVHRPARGQECQVCFHRHST